MKREDSIIFESTINHNSSSQQEFDDLDSRSSNSAFEIFENFESNRIQEEARLALEQHINSSCYNNRVVESVDDNSSDLNRNEMDTYTFTNSNSIIELVDLVKKRGNQTENRYLIDLFYKMADKATNLMDIPGDEITLQLTINNFIGNILILVVNSLQLKSDNKEKKSTFSDCEDLSADGQQKFAESIKKENVSKLSSILANCLMRCDEKKLAEKIERAFSDNINNAASIMFKNDYDPSNFIKNNEDNHFLVIILKERCRKLYSSKIKTSGNRVV